MVPQYSPREFQKINLVQELRVRHLCVGCGMEVRDMNDVLMKQLSIILTGSYNCVMVIDADGIKNILYLFE